jgi:hypothetical protein
MPQEAQFDYAKLPDGSYAKFPKGTSPDVMRGKLVAAGLLKSINEATGSITAPRKDLFGQITDDIGDAMESMAHTPQRLVENTKKYYQEGKNPVQKGVAPFRAEGDELRNLLMGVYRSTPVGMIGQPLHQNLANALMMMGGEAFEPVRGVSEAATSPTAVMHEVMRTAKGEGGPTPLPNPTEAGSLIGAMTRGKRFLDVVDAAARDIPINWKPAYEWAQKALSLESRGFTVPKPIKDFVTWVDSRQKGNLTQPGPEGSRIDVGATDPLLYQHARDFEKALGAKIPWDQDTGGIMGGIMKKMRESIGQETASSLKPLGLDVPYLRGKAEFAKAMRAQEKSYGIGKIGGKLAGYGAGTVVGHPLLLGYGGGLAGQGIAGSMVRSITDAGGGK